MKTITSRPQISLNEMVNGQRWSFDFLVASSTITPDGEYKRKTVSKVEKRFIEKNDQGYLFAVEMKHEKKGAIDDLAAFEHEMSYLGRKILLYTNSNGEIVSIVNRNQIQEDWYDKRKELKTTFLPSIPNMAELLNGVDAILDDGQDFKKMIQCMEVYNLLFPPIYDLDLLNKESVIQGRVLDNFFHHNELPLVLKTKIEAKNMVTGGFQVVRSGVLDTYGFDQDAVSDFMSETFDVHRSNLTYKATYFEGYDLDAQHSVDKVNSLLNVEIPEIFSYKCICRLIKNQ